MYYCAAVCHFAHRVYVPSLYAPLSELKKESCRVVLLLHRATVCSSLSCAQWTSVGAWPQLPNSSPNPAGLPFWDGLSTTIICAFRSTSSITQLLPAVRASTGVTSRSKCSPWRTRSYLSALKNCGRARGHEARALQLMFSLGLSAKFWPSVTTIFGNCSISSNIRDP